MPKNNIIGNIFYIILIIAICWSFIKYVEKRNIFFPMRSVELYPHHVGLAFEDVNFKTDDGVELNGWFVPAGSRRATVLFCHGNAGNISHRLEVVDIFNRIGLNVFIFDYRGYGKSKGRPSEKGTYLDAMAAYNWLIKEKGAGKESIILYGKSLGAAVAVELAGKVGHGVLVIESAFTSVKDMAREIYPFLPVGFIIAGRYDSINKIQGIKTPKLIIHSRDDEIVPYSHGERIFKAASEPKEFLEMRGGHNDAAIMAKNEFKKSIQSFLEKYHIL